MSRLSEHPAGWRGAGTVAAQSPRQLWAELIRFATSAGPNVDAVALDRFQRGVMRARKAPFPHHDLIARTAAAAFLDLAPAYCEASSLERRALVTPIQAQLGQLLGEFLDEDARAIAERGGWTA